MGAPGCVSPAEPSRVCTAGDCQQATVRSPASWGLRGSAGPFLLEPQAGLQASPTHSWVVCRMGQWTGCPSSPAPPRHPRPKAISCRSRKFLRRAPRLWHGAAAVLVSDERAWGGGQAGARQGPHRAWPRGHSDVSGHPTPLAALCNGFPGPSWARTCCPLEKARPGCMCMCECVSTRAPTGELHTRVGGAS